MSENENRLPLDRNALLQSLPEDAERYFGKRPKTLKYLGGGSFGKAFRLDYPDGERIVVKAYRVEGMNETEAFQLRLLGEHTRVPMPKPLFTEKNLLGMSYIEGRDVLTEPRFLAKPRAARERFAREVVTGMLDWHEVSGTAFGHLQNPQYSTWQAFYRTVVDEVLEGVARVPFSERQRETLELASVRFDDILSEDAGPPTLIHGDLNVMNIMADPKTFRLTGFIDPFNSFWADKEYDLFHFRHLMGWRYGLYEEYKRRAKLSRRVDLKTAYYMAVNEALAYLRAGVKFELNHILADRRLRAEMKKAF
ncbi:MAG: phosphotransferase [Oscillospiraceae bacterium]|nr:phosphotransferase [Oscillospiraceae bacterium]